MLEACQELQSCRVRHQQSTPGIQRHRHSQRCLRSLRHARCSAPDRSWKGRCRRSQENSLEAGQKPARAQVQYLLRLCLPRNVDGRQADGGLQRMGKENNILQDVARRSRYTQIRNAMQERLFRRVLRLLQGDFQPEDTPRSIRWNQARGDRSLRKEDERGKVESRRRSSVGKG